MPAHVPRRVFARSFVITLAAIPACHHDDPPTYNPPPPATDVTHPSATPSASAIASVPPQLGPVADRGWYVTMNSGKCEASSNNMACPPGETCNPPPPKAYPCPTNVPANAMPISITHIIDAPNCTAEYQQPFSNAGCPPNMHCNPPPPKMISVSVPCPK